MEFLEAARPGKRPNVRVPVGFTAGMSNRTAEKIFNHVWDRHVCDLFSPSDMPGFEGKCYKHTREEVMAQAGGCDWCKGDADRPDEMAVEIVAQMAQSISSMMQ
ncbi:unnamed protein product, partial [Closterium sp. NIES-54]